MDGVEIPGVVRLAASSTHARRKGEGVIEEVSRGIEWQTDLLEQYDSGVLLQKLNSAIAAWGHGRLRSEAGDHLDIGGSTGGGSRRLIDGWVMPNWRDFL